MILQHAFSKFTCFVFGHRYCPMYMQAGGKVQYTCDSCNEKTEWMHKKQHREFIRTNCPTWGERGSDSQGYRNETAEIIPIKTRRKK